jgi:hypothetical protein
MVALCDPVDDAIFSEMEKLTDAGYEFEDVTIFGFWLFDLVDNHLRCHQCVIAVLEVA